MPWRKNAVYIATLVVAATTFLSWRLIELLGDMAAVTVPVGGVPPNTAIIETLLTILITAGITGTLTLAALIVTDPGVPQEIVKDLIETIRQDRKGKPAGEQGSS